MDPDESTLSVAEVSNIMKPAQNPTKLQIIILKVTVKVPLKDAIIVKPLIYVTTVIIWINPNHSLSSVTTVFP